MSLKDYELIARVFKLQTDRFARYVGRGIESEFALAAVHKVAIDLAIELKQDNPRFDADKFMSACGF